MAVNLSVGLVFARTGFSPSQAPYDCVQLTWKRLSKEEIQQLERTSDPAACKECVLQRVGSCSSRSVLMAGSLRTVCCRLIDNYCKCRVDADDEQAEVLVDLYFYLLAYVVRVFLRSVALATFALCSTLVHAA